MNILRKMITGTGLATALVAAASMGVTAQQQVGPYSFEALSPIVTQGGAAIDHIAALDDGRIGILGGRCPGDGGCHGASWSSADGGQTWQEARPDIAGFYVALLADGARYLAVSDLGPDAATHKAAVYESADGLSWTQLSTLNNALVGAAQITPDGIALVGADFREADGFGNELAGYPTLWLSDDGVDWTAHEISPPMYERGGDELQRPEWFSRGPDGSWMASMIHVEFQDEGDIRTAVVWHATPELAWSQVALPAELVGAEKVAFVRGATPEGFLLGTMDIQGDTSGVWLTADGSDWEQVADTGAIPHIERLATPPGDAAIAFKYAYVPPVSGEPQLLAGSPAYTSADGRVWENAGMLEGVSVSAVSALDDGSILAAGRSAPCADFPSCAFGVPEDDVPVVMLGTPS